MNIRPNNKSVSPAVATSLRGAKRRGNPDAFTWHEVPQTLDLTTEQKRETGVKIKSVRLVDHFGHAVCTSHSKYVKCELFHGDGIMTERRYIVLGDTTTHGGTVITAWGQDGPYPYTIDGIPIACVGDKVTCPKCKGIHTILGPGAIDPPMSVNGKTPSVEGDSVSDGSKVVSRGQFRATHGGPGDGSHVQAAILECKACAEETRAEKMAQAAAATAMASAAETDSTEDEDKEKWITFRLDGEINCEGLQCVAFFDDGSKMDGTFDTDNQVMFENVSGENVKRVEIKFENPDTGSSFADLLLERIGG